MSRFILSLTLAMGISLFACGDKSGGDAASEKKDSSGVVADPGNKVPETPEAMDPKEICKENLNQIFALIDKGDYKTVAPMIVYRGSDEARKWKSPCDYSGADDKTRVDKLCAKIKSIRNDVTKMDWDEFQQESESEGEWNVWKVTFYYKDGTDQPITFAFLKNDGFKGYLLGDIDN